MSYRSPALAPGEIQELLREQDLLVDLVLLLRACPDLPPAPLLDAALALQDRPCGGRVRSAGR